MFAGGARVSEAGTILIGVGDAVLADSLRFSLEMEGYSARFCDERSLLPLAAAHKPGCLVLDQHVFAKLTGRAIADLSVPVVLMVGQRTQRLMDRAKAAGVTHVVETPLLGGVLFKEIRKALDGCARPGGNSSS
jgi:FixJ family two-component response regulator